MTNASPAVLLDTLRARYGLTSDAALARKLNMAPPNVSKLRRGTLPLGATVILNIHETLGMAVEQIRELAGAPRAALGAVVEA